MKKSLLIAISILLCNLYSTAQGTISTLNCSAAFTTGTLYANTTAVGISSLVPYTGGNGGSYNEQVVASYGVFGLTANLAPGFFAVGSGSLNYIITGVPSGSGTAYFNLLIGGQACPLSLNVLPPQGVITSLSCGTATNNGILIAGTSTSGVTSSVPYTGGNGGTYNGQTVASTGVTGLTATLAAGVFNNGSGNLTYTISGTPQGQGNASFALSIGGQTCTLSRTVYQAAIVNTLSCGSSSNNGLLTVGVPATGVTSNVPYTMGNGGGYSGQTVNSTGVLGLTATRTAGVLFNGSGSVQYVITGTPQTGGTANFAINLGGKSCTLSRTVYPVGSITALNCSSSTNNGTLTSGTSASAVSSSVPYTGGNGGTHNGQTVASTGVTGLTATLASGIFASGAGNLVYTITGTPSTSGTANFALNIGGKTCTLSRTVNLPAGTVTALNCSSATNNGTLTSGTAASGVSSIVPYTGGNGGTHNGQAVSSTGVTGLTATLGSGTFANGSGSLVYTITGTPASSGTASFALNIGGKTCTLSRTVYPIGSVTALNCASATNTGTLTSGTIASGVSSSVPYTGGNGGTHNGQTVTSTGVTGLTATLASGIFASGSGSLIYTISGTPASSGTANFALNIGGKTCTLARTVNLPVGTITALNCSTATNNGTLSEGTVASGVSSSVSYTGGNGGTHGGQIVASTGVTGLTATLAAGTFVNGSGSLLYTISGAPTSSGTASFALNIGGKTCTLNRTINVCTPANVYNSNITYGTMSDQQGNVYKTVVIGSQEWMAENLKTSVYRNGTTIPNVTANAQWSNLTTGAWCSYSNNNQQQCPNGKLYNWYAVANTNGLCPVGWHVPTTNDWTNLENYLGGAFVAGGKLKSTSSQYWQSPNTGADNQSGFSGLPSGSRSSTGTSFADLGLRGYWWSSTSINNTTANRFRLSNDMVNSQLVNFDKRSGFSVRCIKDTPLGARVDHGNDIEGMDPFSLLSDRSINLFPNPTFNSINVSIYAAKATNASIQIMDMLGKTVVNKSEALVEGLNMLNYDLTEAPNGVYLVHIVAEDDEAFIKLIKE